MRVGVYIDGFNLYYGGRAVVGRSASGWRWLDLRQLSERLLNRRVDWLGRGAAIERIVYCTAFIDGATNPSGRLVQDAYVAALRQQGSFDLLEEGTYVTRVKVGPLATKGPRGRPVLATSQWPVMVKDSAGGDVPDARFLVSYQHWEEKGSDVNVASHLLVDVLDGVVDGAIVVSNDSDLRYPVQEARRRVPVGTVNPGQGYLAGDLRGRPTDGVGGALVVQARSSRLHLLPTPGSGWHHRQAATLVGPAYVATVGHLRNSYKPLGEGVARR
ncbi:MAG: NYN domain-containing protein [Acidimicrobiales bacterium]